MRKILPRSFYDRDPIVVAKHLLGKFLVRKLMDGSLVSGKIIEVEAYLPKNDPAAHSYKGERSWNKSLYKTGGHAYVHTLRHHALLDIVTGKEQTPGSVLIRSVFPEEGVRLMEEFRHTNSLDNIANGPGKLCQAFSITKADDGIDVTKKNSTLWLEDRGINISKKSIESAPRIGISKGAEKPLRFTLRRSDMGVD